MRDLLPMLLNPGELAAQCKGQIAEVGVGACCLSRVRLGTPFPKYLAPKKQVAMVYVRLFIAMVDCRGKLMR